MKNLVPLLILAVLGFLAWKVLGQKPPPPVVVEVPTTAPATGTQNVAPKDTFSEILGLVNNIVGGVRDVAQTSARTT